MVNASNQLIFWTVEETGAPRGNPRRCRDGDNAEQRLASQRQEPEFDSRLGSFSVWILLVLPVSAWVSSGCSSSLPQSKHVQIKWIGYAKFSLSARGH